MMRAAVALTLVLVLSVSRTAHGLPAGAPQAACATMMQNHGAAAQANPGPFTVYHNIPMVMAPSTNYQVRVFTSDNSLFQGVFCQVRQETAESISTPIGTWITQAGVQTVDCTGAFPTASPSGAITHMNRLGGTGVQNRTLYWSSPAEAAISALPLRLQVVCSVTVTFSTIYVRIPSTVFYSRTPPAASTAAPVETTAPPSAPSVTTPGSSCPAAVAATTDAERYRAYLDCWSVRFEEWNRSYQAWLASGGRGCLAP